MRLANITIGVLLGFVPTLAAAADWTNHPENTWVRESPREGAPSPRYLYEGSGAWDPWEQKFIRWGGHDGIPQGFHLFLWDLKTGRWQQRFPNTSPPGSCCIDGANVFDVANRCFVRFPGASLGHGWQWSRGVHLKRSHVWLYDPKMRGWTNMRPPPYKEPPKYSRDVLGSLDAGGTYDANHQVAISFGGQGDAGGMNNLFVYDAYANRLERLDAANSPSPRDGMGICYDTTNDCLVVFGSQYGDDEQTWIYRYRTNRWEALDLKPRPPGKKRKTYSTIPKMAFDSVNGVCVCVVWLEEKGGALETWALDVAKLQWTKMNPAVEPEPTGSRARNMGFDPALNLVFLESVNPKGEARIWTYRYRKAPPSDRPEPPTDLTVVTDPGKATLTWKPSPSAGIREYRVYRAETDKPWLAEFALIGTVESDSAENALYDARGFRVPNGYKFDDSGLETGKVYIYTIRVVDKSGRESRDGLKVRTQPRVLNPLLSNSAPNTVYATVIGPKEVGLDWARGRGLVAAGTPRYNVYRGLVHVATNTTLKGSWGCNDPEYVEPVVDRVLDLTDIQKIAEIPAPAVWLRARCLRLPRRRLSRSPIPLRRQDRRFDAQRVRIGRLQVRSIRVYRPGGERRRDRERAFAYALTIPAEPENVMLRETGGDAEIKWSPIWSRTTRGEGYRVYRVESRTVTRLTPELITENSFTIRNAGHARFVVVAVDSLGQEGQPSSPVWSGQSYQGFFEGPWHQ